MAKFAGSTTQRMREGGERRSDMMDLSNSFEFGYLNLCILLSRRCPCPFCCFLPFPDLSLVIQIWLSVFFPFFLCFLLLLLCASQRRRVQAQARAHMYRDMGGAVEGSLLGWKDGTPVG
ncbi:hypothetical protein BDZ91DRAFT_714929 [Kalaharituber pfeilii]|nr:hypothetical protein BDZ91DRAFT_714929 [Kalaharituber pfeilii]